MSNIDNGDMSASPAFDRYGDYAKAVDDRGYTTEVRVKGLTKREAFAMAAMQGILSKGDISAVHEVAEDAVAYADEVLSKLESTT